MAAQVQCHAARPASKLPALASSSAWHVQALATRHVDVLTPGSTAPWGYISLMIELSISTCIPRRDAGRCDSAGSSARAHAERTPSLHSNHHNRTPTASKVGGIYLTWVTQSAETCHAQTLVLLATAVHISDCPHTGTACNGLILLQLALLEIYLVLPRAVAELSATTTRRYGLEFEKISLVDQGLTWQSCRQEYVCVRKM